MTDKIERIGAFIHQGIKAQRAAERNAMSQPPPEGLPQEFHEDWVDITNGTWGTNEISRWRAALEALAAERLALTRMISSPRLVNENAVLRTRLRERVEKCSVPVPTPIQGRLWWQGETCNENNRCEQCRLDLAVLEGQK